MGLAQAKQSEMQLWTDRLAKFRTGQLSDRVDLQVGRTSPVLRALGVPSQPIYINANKVSVILDKHNKRAKAGEKIPTWVIDRLPELLADPVAVVQHNHAESDVHVHLDADSADGRPIVAAIKLKGTITNGQTVPIVMSIFPLTDAAEKLQGAAKRGQWLYVKDEGRSVARFGLLGNNRLRGPTEAGLLASTAPKKLLRHADVFKTPKFQRAVRAVRPISAQGRAHRNTGMQGPLFIPNRRVREELTRASAGLWQRLRGGQMGAADGPNSCGWEATGDPFSQTAPRFRP